MIKYLIENKVSIDAFKSVLVNSTLGERRPVDDENTLSKNWNDKTGTMLRFG